MKLLPTSFLLLALAAAPSAQVTYLGESCTGASQTAPVLTLTGMSVEALEFEVLIEGVPNSPGLLIAGLELKAPPIELTGAGIPGCELFVTPVALALFVTDAEGEYRLPVTTWVAGLTVFVQAFVADADPGATPGSETLGGMTRAAQVHSLDAGGEIVITEIMKDPDFVSDVHGEWIELHNHTDTDIDIEGWLLRDEGTDAVILDNAGSGIVVPAGGYITLGNQADPGLNGGVSHAATYVGFFLENGADEVVLQSDPVDELTVVDRVAYLDWVLWPDAIGSSLALDAAYAHSWYNDFPERWSAGTCATGGSPHNPDTGTPGSSNDECHVVPPPEPSGELIFTEVMQNPKGVFDEVGEWFELYNTTAASIDLSGWTIVAGGIEIVGTSVVVPAGGYALFAGSDNPAENGSLPAPDWVWSELFLGNSSELLQVYDAAGELVCELAYDNGATFPDPNGRSMSLDAGMLTLELSADGANWCEAQTAWAGGDFGTPRAANGACP